MNQEIFDFEWHEEQNFANIKKHGISFEEAITVFDDIHAIYKQDSKHSIGELRSFIIGYSSNNILLVVVFTERSQNVRILSVRKATKNERRYYEA